METISGIKSKSKLYKIELNAMGDYMVISPDDKNLFDRFVKAQREVITITEEVDAQEQKIQEHYAAVIGEGSDSLELSMEKSIELLNARKVFSDKAINIIDNLFGIGTVKKFFREIYEEIPEFLPNAECIIDFFEQVTPVIEKLFEEVGNENKKKMDKYRAIDVEADNKATVVKAPARKSVGTKSTARKTTAKRTASKAGTSRKTTKKAVK